MRGFPADDRDDFEDKDIHDDAPPAPADPYEMVVYDPMPDDWPDD